MMNRHPFASLLLSALLLASFAHADTNVAGEEIVISEPDAVEIDSDDEAIDFTESSLSTYDNDGMQMDLLLRESPEEPSLAQNETGDLWQRIRSGYGMKPLQSPFTATHESWYASRPEYMQRMLTRSQRYLYHVVEEVQKRGMPTEVALLPMVESAFNPTAYSRSKASGIWQFMPATGKHFGLNQNWWRDNRRDVTAATDAALNYLEKLHVMFGTWELALAAYNAGEGTVQRAIERNRKQGLPTDYQSLQLPPETRNYVPKLQAVKNIVTNPEQYGLSIPSIPDKPYFTKVQAPAKIDVHLAAKLAGVPMEEFVSLNPAYNRPVLGSRSGKELEILLPVGKDAEFETNLANYDKPLVSWKTYQSRRGERLETISNKFGISVAKLREVNDLPARGRLRAGQPLLVPAADGEAGIDLAHAEEPVVLETVAEAEPVTRRYTVRKGDSLQAIAKRSGVTTRSLMAMNGLKSSRVKAGQVLRISGGTKLASAKPTKAKKTIRVASAKKRSHYTIRRGDSLISIARKLNVAASDLKRWNNINGKHTLMPGRTLVIRKEEA